MLNFNQQEVLDLEAATIAALPPGTRVGSRYFKEPVAQALYKAWQEDHTDHRLMKYCFPLVQGVMFKNATRLVSSSLEPGEVFNTLVLHLPSAFQNYVPSRGRLFTYLTLFLGCRIINLTSPHKYKLEQLEDWCALVDDSSFHVLEDFKAFLPTLKAQEGPTANRMIDALIDVLDDHEPTAILSQCHIISRIAQLTTFPTLVVEPFYQKLLERYTAEPQGNDLAA